MKRLIAPSTASAIGWWAANPNALKADLFQITLPTGQVIYATEGQWDLTIPASISPVGSGTVTFRSQQYGVFSRGKITSEAGFKCQANNMTLDVVPKIGATYPGLNISVLNAAVNHLYDGAHVQVWTAYMPFGEYGNVQVVESKFQGWILNSPKIGRLLCQFNCGDPFFLLNQKVPSRLLQSSCYKSFADSNCGLDPSKYTVGFFAASESTQYALYGQGGPPGESGLGWPDGYFTQGVVTCTAGANKGLSQTVKKYAAGVIYPTMPFLLPVSPGDQFAVIKGCDQTPTTCATMTRYDYTVEPGDWTKRFGGTPFVPAPSTTL